MKQFFRQFFLQRGGNVLMLTGVALFLLIGVTGVGVDLGRQQLVRLKLQQATDAVAVAIAGMPEGATAQQKEAAAQRYFILNYPTTYLNLPRPTVSYSEPNGVVEVTANLTVPPVFIGVIGISEMQAQGFTRVASATSSDGHAYDIVMILDVSGSMGWSDEGSPAHRAFPLYPAGTSRMARLQLSVANFLNNIFGDQQNSDFYSIASVLYSGVIEAKQPNFSNNKQVLGEFYTTNLIPHYRAGTIGGTAAQLGASYIIPRDSKTRIKVAIIMTDGQNTDAKFDKPSSSEDALMLQKCREMKAANVLVYTIAFGSDLLYTPEIATLMRDCASGTSAEEKRKYAYQAVTGDELDGAFNAIFTHIKKLRIID